MPIYEYKCTDCTFELEKLQKISDAPLTDCPECGKPTLKKMISAAGFRLKGSGWYETDFKSGNKKNVGDSGASDSGSSDSGSSDKGSSKTGSGKEDGSRKADSPKKADSSKSDSSGSGSTKKASASAVSSG